MFEMLGWPCGERLWLGDTPFLRWRAPFVDAARGARGGAAGDDEEGVDADAVVEHTLDCAAEDALQDTQSQTGL